MALTAERQGAYTSAFEAFRRDPVFGSGAVERAREQAFERFLQTGFPTTRDEEWRFTSVAPIAETVFERAPAVELAPAAVAALDLGVAGARIVVVNGRLSPALSSLAALPSGVTVRMSADDARVPAKVVEFRPKARAARAGTPFLDLNAAFHPGVLSLSVAAGAVVDGPVHVLFIAVADGPPQLVSPRMTVTVGERAEFDLVETWATVGRGVAFTNAAARITVQPGGVLRHVTLQRESADAFHIGAIDVEIGRAGVYHSTAVTVGGRIARTDLSATLDGDGAECTLNGLYVADGESLVDTHTTIEHARPFCPSHEVYKGILAGRARAVFNGKIVVAEGAQKTNAKQTNKALLLSDAAQINTKPQLEIFADDVKCTHGAAIGQLDEDALFYLRARGIAEADARNLLIHAFAAEVLDGIRSDDVRTRIMELVEGKLAI